MAKDLVSINKSTLLSEEREKQQKRALRNSLFLALRMAVVLVLQLYLSRVILNVLGVEDFGIYNVVGGIVYLFTFLSTSLSGASSRFITVAIGEGNLDEVNKVFSAILIVHVMVALIVFICAEVVGVWLITNYLDIPNDRLNAALWIFQSTVISATFIICCVPFYSLLIALEKMHIYAFVSGVVVVLNLLAIYLAEALNQDKLICYASLFALAQIICNLVYPFYCKYKIGDLNIKFSFNNPYIKKIGIYSLWILNGDLAVVGYTQGINILLNIFFGPIANAARGVSVQVQSAVQAFFNSFQSAVKPQIVKAYASGDYSYMHLLILSSMRYSFYLALLMVVPLFVNIDWVLRLWLGIIPDYASDLVRVILLVSLNAALSGPVLTALHATGDIKIFQLVEGTLLLSIVPICYVLATNCSLSPVGFYWVYIVVELIVQFIRVFIVFPKINLKIVSYFNDVLFPVLKVSLIIGGILLSFSWLFQRKGGYFVQGCLSFSLVAIITLSVVWLFGLSKNERTYLLRRCQSFIKGS